MEDKDKEPKSTTIMAASVFHMDAFDEKTMKWSRWVKRFETALTIFEVQPAKKTQYLLHYMGTVAYDRLCDKALPQTPEQLTYKDITDILEKHYNPAPNEILLNFRFHSRKQNTGESAAEFLVALRHLAVGCNFGEYVDKAIRNQFVYGLANQKIQSRLLERENLTLADAANITDAYESAEKGFEEINRNNETIDKLQERKIKKKMVNTPQLADDNNRRCFRCGNADHTANKCKHFNKVCSFCKKKGHLRRVCLKAKKYVGTY